MKKVGRNVYGSGDTIVTKTSRFFQGLTLGAEGGGLYAVLYGMKIRAYCSIDIIKTTQTTFEIVSAKTDLAHVFYKISCLLII